MKNLQKIQIALRTTAERDRNDIIANAASALAVRMESFGREFGMKFADLTEVDLQMIRYALGRMKEYA